VFTARYALSPWYQIPFLFDGLKQLNGSVLTEHQSNTVKPRFTNASDHEQFGLRTNFPNTKRLG